MRRLLCAEEESLCLPPSHTPAARAAFRRERRQIFRGYLRMMSSDVRRLSRGVRLATLHAPEDRSADILKLISLERTLHQLLWQAELRLFFHWMGVAPVDVTQLIDAMQRLEFSLREFRVNLQTA